MRPTLDQRIRSLSDQIDRQIRTELQAHLASLRRAGNPVAVLLGMSRLSLMLVRKVFDTVGEKVPSDNLYHCLVRLSGGDPALKITGLKLLPKEVDTRTHAVRVLSNMVDHAVEAAEPTVSDAEEALSLYLRLLRWYYVEFDRGPKLPSIERPSRWWVRWASLAAAAGVVTLLAAGLVAWSLYRSPAPANSSQEPPGKLTVETQPGSASASPPTTSPPEPPRDLAGLLEHGKAPAAGGRPRLALDLLKWEANGQSFVPLADGAALRSGEDQYAVVARPETAGYLYLFQIDSQGYVNWFFPQNPDPNSHGTNPVAAGLPVCVPPAESRSGLFLDDHVGKESIFAVLSAARWPALEEHLTSAVRSRTRVAVSGKNRGAAGSLPLAPPAEVKLLNTTVRLVSPALEANGSFLQVVRWFEHR